MAGDLLVFDTSPLCHFARAGQLDTLRNLVEKYECVTTRAVLGELREGAQLHAAIGDVTSLEWVGVVSCDDLEVLYLFGQYMNQLGNLARNAGEASVLAWAEVNSAAVYVDDQVACNVGRQRGVRVHRTLHLVINAYRSDLLTEAAAQDLIGSLADADARFPAAARKDLFEWARTRNPPLL